MSSGPGALSRHNHLSEFCDPLVTNQGVKSPAVRKALALANLGLTATAAEINAAADISANVTVVPAGGAAVTPLTGGGTYLIPAVTANVTMTLPAVATLGEKHRLVYIGGATDAEDWVITAAALFVGGLAWLTHGTPDIEPVYANGSTHNTLTINNPAAGTVVEFIGNGTSWTVNGQSVAANTPAFSAV